MLTRLDALKVIAAVYPREPMVVTRRGGLNEYNSMIHLFCEKVDAIADAAGLRYFVLNGRVPLELWSSTITKAFENSQITRRPVAVFVDLMGGQP